MASFNEVVATTIDDWLTHEIPNVFRKRKFLSALMEKGLVTYGHSGDQMSWVVRDTRSSLVGIDDAASLDFARTRKRRKARLDWRGYAATDSMTHFESLQNRGTEAKVKYIADKAKVLFADAKDDFCEKMYIDGNAAGNSDEIHGLDSCLGNSAASGKAALASDTYAGLSTVLGNYGGSWTGTHPAGTGDALYDFWSPLLVDYTHADWTAASAWATDAVEALRWGITHQGVRTDNELDIILQEKTLYNDFKVLMDTKERITTARSMDNSILVKLGFGDVINFDGVDCCAEQGIPAGMAYGIPLEKDCIELLCMEDQLFKANLEDFDISSLSTRFAVVFYGNLRLNPRELVKWQAIT